MPKADNGKIGDDFQKLLEIPENKSQICNVFNVPNYKSIDCKNIKFKLERKHYTNIFKKNNPNLKVGNVNSSLRGDFLLEIIKAIVDSKSYPYIQGVMKFCNDIHNSFDYIKGIDSDIRHTIRYMRYNNILFNHIDFNNATELILNNDKEISKYHPIFIEPVLIGTISENDYLKIFYTNEIGFAYDNNYFNIFDKIFINKIDEGTISIKKVNMINVGNIDLYFYIDPKTKYIYLLFYEGEECIYILSHRDNMVRGNCSFINRDKLIDLGTVSLIKKS